MPRLIRDLYFDANLLSELLGDRGRHHSSYNHVRQLVSEGRVRVFGSFKHYDELAPRLRNKGKVSELLVPRFRELAGKYILHDRRTLCFREVQKNKRLSIEEAILPASYIDWIANLIMDPREMAVLTAKVEEQKQAFTKDFEGSKAKLIEHIKSLGDDDREVRRGIRMGWSVTRKDVDKRIQSMPGSITVKGKEIPTDRASWRLPVLGSWVGYIIAHSIFKHIECRAIGPSEMGDWEHYAYAAIPGTLVTDDGSFRRDIAARIELPHVSVITGEECFQMLREYQPLTGRAGSRRGDCQGRRRHGAT